MLRCMSLLLCWFLDAGNKEALHAQLTGVQKAPRHEVAGSWAPVCTDNLNAGVAVMKSAQDEA